MSDSLSNSVPKTPYSATLKDVAALAGVDKSRASVVLNGAKSSAGISQAVRERILAAAAELDYRPNAVGRALSRRRTGLIGFYSSYGHVNARDAFFADVVGGLQDGCEKYQHELLMYSTGRDRAPEDIFRALTSGTIDGLVLFTPPDGPLVPPLAAARLPVVALADAVPELPSVVVDDVLGGRLLAEHLWSRGHQKVLYRKRWHSQTSSDRRFEGFQKVAQAQGMEIIESSGGPSESPLSDWEMAILKSSSRPTAAVGWSDFSAFRLLEGCLNLGLRVPEEVAIAGFDGFRFGFLPARQLSTVRAPWARVAQAAVGLLIDQLEGREVPTETILPVELVIGDTT